MKRFLLIIGAILLGLAVRAQSVTYICSYWFDMNHAQAVTTTFGESGWEAEIDVGSLTEGIHSLHLHVMDTSMKWSAPQSYLFLKLTPSASSSDFTYYFWFDQDHASMQSGALGDGHLLLDVDALNTGMHSLHVMVKGTDYTSTQSYLFFKTDMAGQGGDSYVYHCWFDQDFENQQSDVLGTGHFLLDVTDLEDGIHTLNVMLQGNTLTATQSYLFMKIAVEDPLTELQYHCWFDQDYENLQTGLLGNGLFELEVGDLSNGLHTVNVQLDNGRRTAPLCYLFYKVPLGGHGIAKWEYWLNGNAANRHTVVINPVVDTLDIISLLPVETWPVRSSCFHFHPNGEEPYLNAKNEITLRFCSADGHVLDKSSFYVDEQVQQNITAEVFERNTTETFAAPRDNQITWYKLDAVIGDSLSFIASKACTMQLFAPSGEEVYNASGPESVMLNGLHTWEDGTYYLAVHDVTGSGEVISVTYQYLHKYAVLAYDVHSVGNGGCSTITFQGNGFNCLLDVYLVNDQNDTIRKVDIGHESNTTTTVTFDFNEVNLGVYDAVFQFVDEDIQIQNAIQVDEATPFEFDVSVSFASQFLRTTSNKYVFKVHNNSNMSAYNVPLLVHIYTPDAESLTRVDVDGFDVKSNIRNLFGSYYTDSLDNEIEQKRLSSGDLFGFLKDSHTEFVPDAPYLHRIFITPDLRPNTTETFTVAVKSTNIVYVYMWYPEEWENENPTENLSRIRLEDDRLRGYVSIPTWMCAQNEYLEDAGLPPRFPGIQCDPKEPDGPGSGGPSTPVNSFDPNDIRGYLSESGSHHMRQEIQNVQYEIEFENDTTLATAAAHTIIVRDTLDATKFDLNSLAARSVTIGDKRLDLNGEQTFARTLDMRPELYVIAQIEQDYDPTTGIVEWTIQSLDPMTMEPTDNPYQGVLPVNYFGNGVGFIDYSINLKQAFADGTAISNRAGIIFDQEEVIMTPTWTNIVDAVKPTSHIEEVTFEDDTLNFSFISSDNRSGVWYHSLYYRNDSTYQEWQVKVPRIFENSYMLRFNEYQTTEYLVMAVDSAGNVEDKEMVAEYIHYYDGPTPTCQSIDLVLGWNWFSTYLDITLDDLKTALVEAMPGSDISIKSQTQNISYNPNNHRWLGTLAWDVAKMYAIKTSIPCEITLIGTPLNPSEQPITILNGANWIGFPFNASMSLSNAFAGFSVNGDRIKSQTNNALYNGIRWQGQLNALESGKGYIYISNSLEERTLTFPTSAK